MKQSDLRNKEIGTREIIKSAWWAFSFCYKFERWLVIENIAANVIMAVFTYLQLASFSNIVNEVIKTQQAGTGFTQSLLHQILLLMLSFLIPSIFRSLEMRNENQLRPKLFTHAQLYMIDHLSKLDIAAVENSEFQKKLAFANEWGIQSIHATFFNAVELIRNAVALLTAAIVLYLIKPALVVLAFGGAIPVYFSEEKYGKLMFRLYTEQTDDTRIRQDRNSFFFNPTKLIEVFIFNIASFLRSQIATLRTTWDQKVIKAGKQRALVYFLTDLFSFITLFIAIYLIVLGGINGTLAIGTLVLAFTAYRNFGGNTTQFFYSMTRTQEQARYASRWREVIETAPYIKPLENALRPIWTTPPTIHFKNVSFIYPNTDRIVLKNIDLVIKPGEKLALVGLNGAGKTTLIKLLARVYDPSEGSILIDTFDLKTIDPDWWRMQLGILFQNFSNFQMTARESIAISRPDKPIDDEKVIRAAEESGAVDFIKNFPKQYNQIIWKGFQDGVELSQGQHQRMAVARILYRDALISVLDEPTSAIDAVAEEKIFEVLETKMEGKTVVLISHRFSTVKNADKIAVIEHGELKELGSHKELMKKKKGRYAELYTMQASRYLEEK